MLAIPAVVALPAGQPAASEPSSTQGGALRDALEQLYTRYELACDVSGQTPGWHARVPGRGGAAGHVPRRRQR